MPAETNPSRGDWEIWDHGSPAVDQFWRKVLGRNAVQRHASLGGAIPPEQSLDVDPDLDTRFFPPSFFVCEAIWAAS